MVNNQCFEKDFSTPIPTTKDSKTPKNNPQKHIDISELYMHTLPLQRGEVALWKAVITQMLLDALSEAKSSEAIYHKSEAIKWLRGNSADFIMVCALACLDADYVKRKAKQALNKNVKWRAKPGHGKRYLERKRYRCKQVMLASSSVAIVPTMTI